MIIVEIAGFLGADPEERFTTTGKRVVVLRVAAHVRQGGQDETVWWRVSIWGDRFDRMLRYLKKGSSVIVIGEMGKPESYVAKDGSTQVSLSLTAEIIKFSPFGRPEGSGGGASVQGAGQFDQQTAARSEELAGVAQESYATFGASEQEPDFPGDELPF